MMLADVLPQPNIIHSYNTMDKTILIDELEELPTISTEPTPTNNNSSSISSIKIPLVSLQPILATSPNYILANEFTRRRNQFVLLDDNFQRFFIRSTIKQTILDGLWYDNQQKFLLLTETNIFALDPNTKTIELLHDLIPNEKKNFKCFTFLNNSTLLIAYNEWGAEYIDKWQQDNENGFWKLIGKLPLSLTYDEFIGDMLTIIENDCSHLVITIYNHLTEQWRIEFRKTETLLCDKAILLPGSNIVHDYRLISIQNAESDVKLLVFSSTNSNIIAIDSEWKKIQLNYKNPVQRMALVRENYLIVRTKDRVDIHLFL